MAQSTDFRLSRATIILFVIKNVALQCGVLALLWLIFNLIIPLVPEEAAITGMMGGLFAGFIGGFIQLASHFYYRVEWRQNDLRLHHLFGAVDVPFHQIRSIRFSTPNLISRIFLASGENSIITPLRNYKRVHYAISIEKYSNAAELRAQLLELKYRRESEQSSVAEPSLKGARIA